ncbi:MAG: zinc-binding alcohol dehydrogenase family protein [Planctomycetaceae bacterium]|nr:zinc-binding alcohol dehydrogenase family protein [Planctomycetaceae bacterium]
MNERIIITKPGEVGIEAAPMPTPGPNEALLKVLYGGICGSDLGTYRGTFAYVQYPRIPGHELAVEVVEAPQGSTLAPGTLATVNPYFNCGTCYPCRSGRVNCCTGNETLGCQRDGGFARYIAMPVERIYPAPGLDAKQTVLVEPFCISYHGVKRAAIQPGEKVLVVGAGTIGIMAMLSVKHFGGVPYVADVAPDKLVKATAMGAAGTFLNTSPEALAAWTAETTGGDGFAVTVEAVGLAATFQDCIDSVAFSGRTVLIGVSKQTLDFNFTLIQKKELAVFGSRNAVKSDFNEVMNIIRAGGLPADGVVTDVYPFAQAAEAFREFSDHAGEKLKVLLDFQK